MKSGLLQGISVSPMFVLVLLLRLLPEASGIGVTCPITNCGAPMPASINDTNTYTIMWQVGKFTCTSCDETTCPGCGVLCDIKSCSGGLGLKDCLCTRGLSPSSPPGGAGADTTVEKLQCDDKCSVGACGEPGLSCALAESGCDPWWKCSAPPPGDMVGIKVKEAPPAMLQRSSRRALRGNAGVLAAGGEARTEPPQGSQELALLEAGARSDAVAEAMSAASASKSAQLPPPGPLANFAMQLSRYTCSSAALPPKIMNPITFQNMSRGYILFERSSCVGAAFDTMCFCWDNFKLLKGEDPMTSSMTCDAECGSGPCDGQTCSKDPPPPPKTGEPAPLITAPMPPDRRSEDVAVPVDELDTSVTESR